MTPKINDIVFWHDPDDNIGSGIGVVFKICEEMLSLAMLSGSEVEVLRHEVTQVSDTDVVGINETGLLLFYSEEHCAVYMDGSRLDDGMYDMDDEERRRVTAIRESMSR
jgi:hypothetical protein